VLSTAQEIGGEGLSRRESAREAAARFGVAEHAALEEFVGGIVTAGCDAIIVHARKAVLGAWSPRDNREIPPLRYDVVQALKARFAPVTVVLNGGLRAPEQVVSELAWADGVMLGARRTTVRCYWRSCRPRAARLHRAWPCSSE
jgi:hypothetical protein